MQTREGNESLKNNVEKNCLFYIIVPDGHYNFPIVKRLSENYKSL